MQCDQTHRQEARLSRDRKLLDGKVAIVTGAARGLGRAHALYLAAEGAAVVVNDPGVDGAGEGGDTRLAQQVADEILSLGGRAAANFDSVSDWQGSQALVDQAVETFGRLDILVNNAGIVRDRMSFNMGEGDWDTVIDVHLKGHFAPSRFAASYWRSRAKSGDSAGGRIINTTSTAGLYGNAGQANYSAAKAGIVGLTLVLARELQRFGVTVNAIAPRAKTRMTQQAFGDLMAEQDGTFDRMAPENVSPFVAWLASADAAHVTGQIFIVCGSEVTLCRGWEAAEEITVHDRAWTVAEINSAAAALFVEHAPALRPFPTIRSG
jgi:NAD(P)-dependent dehydrogenase (short-subunit alcohol dehydrogenase family)